MTSCFRKRDKQLEAACHDMQGALASVYMLTFDLPEL